MNWFVGCGWNCGFISTTFYDTHILLYSISKNSNALRKGYRGKFESSLLSFIQYTIYIFIPRGHNSWRRLTKTNWLWSNKAFDKDHLYKREHKPKVKFLHFLEVFDPPFCFSTYFLCLFGHFKFSEQSGYCWLSMSAMISGGNISQSRLVEFVGKYDL